MEDPMTVIEKFLGQRVEIPDDLRYDPNQGLWARVQDQDIVFGLSRPAAVLAGGVNDLDWLVQDEATVSKGQDVAFIITGRIAYIHTPFKGVIFFNPEVKQNPALALEDPYGKGWLFRIKMDAHRQDAWKTLADAHDYIAKLKDTEGFKNPEGLKGGVSGICKAVYSGIREQKF
jgi:glycine cleavage system H protein